MIKFQFIDLQVNFYVVNYVFCYLSKKKNKLKIFKKAFLNKIIIETNCIHVKIALNLESGY